MKRKRPCAFCRKWFEPDARVGERQRACCSEECQRKRRARSQAAWLARQPDYFVARRIQERARRKQEEGRDVAPLRLPAPLGRLPWDLAQDELGIQGADFIGYLGKVLVRHAQDEIANQVSDIAAEFLGHSPAGAKDERRAGA